MSFFLIAFAITAGLTPLVIQLARRLRWVAAPRADRWHKYPTALMGGIAIYGGCATAWLLTPGASLPLFLASTGLFVLGVVDDRLHLRPYLKLIGQVAASTVLVANGFVFEALPQELALPLTLVWLVGITNAVNLLDNMDGLAAGVSGIAALAMAVYTALEGAPSVAAPVLALAGACAGFLIYNVNPARIFMGDCGSMFIGFSLAALAIQGTHRSAPNLVLSLLIPVAVLAVPIFDTTLVSATRVLHGRAVSQGGRDHSSHRLVALGLSERSAVLVFYVVTALFGGLAIAATRLSLLVTLLLATVCFVGLAVVGLYLGFIKVYQDQSQVPPHAPLIGGKLHYKKQSLQVVVDVLLIHVAFAGAQLLRFEGELPPDMQRALLAALPTVLATKLLALAVCRAYRGVWRYAGMADGLAAVAGCTLGSVLTALVVGGGTGFKGLSRTALIIDWLLFTLLALSVRTGFSALRELFSMLPPREGPRVLILGAGTEALALIHRLRDPFSPRRAHVLGILDDAPHHQRRTLNGVTVLGRISDLPAAFNEREVSCCLLGVSPRSEEGERILAFCQDHSIPLYGDPEAGPLLPTSLPSVALLDVPRHSAPAGGPGSI